MVFLSFDIEEFDAPIEFGCPISFEKQIDISARGTEAVLDLLKEKGVKATFFCTATFAMERPNLIQRIVQEGHELASHGFYHSSFKIEDLLNSRLKLQEISGYDVVGFRMPRMQNVPGYAIKQAGYKYDSSLNPTWMPGRYNNLGKPTRPFISPDQLPILPASVTPILRFPLFWLSFHNLPMEIFNDLCLYTYRNKSYFNIYFHPWEFVHLPSEPSVKLPFYMRQNTGEEALYRLSELIDRLKRQQAPFGRCREMIENIN
ncbi:MAG: polysaccharide deacetylase family protein [Porphyromonas sp.]|nr:polysaccharide deacetylase family protein [Porphyromonas sp.]